MTDPMLLARYAFVADRLDRNAVVLDYRGGDGNGVSYLRERGLEVYGYYPDPGAMLQARTAGIPLVESPAARRWDAAVCMAGIENLGAPPIGTLMALEKVARTVVIAVPYLAPADSAVWTRLSEGAFPGRRIGYQYDDGIISPLHDEAAVAMIVISERD